MELRLLGRSRSKDESGFTLIELAFVSLLLALLSGVIYGSVITMVRTKNALEERRVSERTAEAVLSRLTRELENRFSEPLAEQEKKESGQANDELPLLLGRSKRAGSVDADSIRFVTIGNVASSEMGNPGLIEVEYRLEPLEQQSIGGQPLFALIREEIPAALQDRRVLEARRFQTMISDKVRGLQFRYRFNRRWVNQWSAKRETLPDAVEVTLSLATENGGTDTYRTAVLLYRQEEG